MIAIAMAAGVLLYGFSMGLFGIFATGGGQQVKEQLILEAYNWSGSETIIGALKNVGQAAIDVGKTDVFLNGMQVATGLGGSCNVVLNPSNTCNFDLGVPAGSWVPGVIYPLKLVSPAGGVFSYGVMSGAAG